MESLIPGGPEALERSPRSSVWSLSVITPVDGSDGDPFIGEVGQHEARNKPGPG